MAQVSKIIKLKLVALNLFTVQLIDDTNFPFVNILDYKYFTIITIKQIINIGIGKLQIRNFVFMSLCFNIVKIVDTELNSPMINVGQKIYRLIIPTVRLSNCVSCIIIATTIRVTQQINEIVAVRFMSLNPRIVTRKFMS